MDKRLIRLGFVYLTALLLVAQLVVVAGHVHLALVAGHAHLGGHSHEDAAVESAPAGHTDQHPSRAPHERRHVCPLCLAQAATGTPLLPSAADFEQPRLQAIAQSCPAADHLCTAAPQRIFQPRAPPFVS